MRSYGDSYVVQEAKPHVATMIFVHRNLVEILHFLRCALMSHYTTSTFIIMFHVSHTLRNFFHHSYDHSISSHSSKPASKEGMGGFKRSISIKKHGVISLSMNYEGNSLPR